MPAQPPIKSMTASARFMYNIMDKTFRGQIGALRSQRFTTDRMLEWRPTRYIQKENNDTPAGR